MEHGKRTPDVRRSTQAPQVTLVLEGPARQNVVKGDAEETRKLSCHRLHVVKAAAGICLRGTGDKRDAIEQSELLGPRRLCCPSHVPRDKCGEPTLAGVLVGSHHAVVGPLEHSVAAHTVVRGDDVGKAFRVGRRASCVLVVLVVHPACAFGAHEAAERRPAPRACKGLVYLPQTGAAPLAQQLPHCVASHTPCGPQHLLQPRTERFCRRDRTREKGALAHAPVHSPADGNSRLPSSQPDKGHRMPSRRHVPWSAHGFEPRGHVDITGLVRWVKLGFRTGETDSQTSQRRHKGPPGTYMLGRARH